MGCGGVATGRGNPAVMRNWQSQPAVTTPAAGEELLFTPGPRLGWVFRDRRELAAPYPEPEPGPHTIHGQAAARITAADQAWQRAWTWIGKPSIALALILVLLAGCEKSVSGSFNLGLTAVTIVVLCCPGLGYAGWRWLQREQSRDATPQEEYRQALADWDQRATAHESAELARLADQPEWGSATVPARHTDVFGGTLAGWQALITVHGASLLAQRPLLAVDLTGRHAAGLLSTTTQRTGIPAATYRLPHDLGRCGLLAELSAVQLADAIAEAVHAGTPGGARADRATDGRVLRELAGVLAGRGVTVQRLAAAVRAAMGYMVPGGVLSPGEQELLTGNLFPAGYRQQITSSLARLDAVLAELAVHAADGWPAQTARYTCLAIDPGPRTAAGEVLTALIAQWLTAQVTTAAGSPPAVIIAGADEITRPHLERLADACELRDTPVTLLFRHLRDDAASMLGGGTAAFMRLGNHAEAEQAASYIGRRHTFVVSSFTATRGGNQTSTRGGSDGYDTGDSYSDARTRGWQGGGFLGTDSGGRTRTRGSSTSRNWSTSWSQADGTSWSEAEARQRVYEYAVEPTALQNLPEYALLLADRSGGALKLRAVECDPAIITLPGASTAPLSPPGSLAHSGMPPAVMNTVNPAGPAIVPPGQYPTGWQQPPAEEPLPAWPPNDQPELPWWRRNQPPDQR
jgi:hypothetical protein